MIIQNWIVKNNIKLLSVYHRPKIVKSKTAVLLLPGFSHAMCDVDYFMSKTARRIVENGISVFQVDLRGHGDSNEKFSKINLDTIREDITVILEYIREKQFDNIICIGRGLTASILAEYQNHDFIPLIIGISPYCVEQPLFLKNYVLANLMEYETADVFKGLDYVTLSDFDKEILVTINALGVLPYHLHGLKISRQFLEDIYMYKSKKILTDCSEKGFWIFPCKDNENDFIKFHDGNFKDGIYDLFENQGLPRNPKWQHNLIDIINSKVNEQINILNTNQDY